MSSGAACRGGLLACRRLWRHGLCPVPGMAAVRWACFVAGVRGSACRGGSELRRGRAGCRGHWSGARACWWLRRLPG